MELFLKILGYASGPVVGAIIGYFTNYLAVKMLFRPYYPKKIGGKRLPFTPGIIPKRQKALAKAIGRAVGENLFTGEDLKKMLLSEETENKVADMALNVLKPVKNMDGDSASSLTADALALRLFDEEGVREAKEKFSLFLSDQLVSVAEKMDIGGIIAAEGKDVLAEKKSSMGMLAMFLSDSLVDSLLSGLGRKVNDFISEKGLERILPAVRSRVGELADTPLEELTASVGSERIRSVVKAAYEEIVLNVVGGFLKELDVASVVEDKVNAMSVKELEKLCLSVMKRELNAIVNLGALIGFILGIVNIFI